jgi:hypothetical protein
MEHVSKTQEMLHIAIATILSGKKMREMRISKLFFKTFMLRAL